MQEYLQRLKIEAKRVLFRNPVQYGLLCWLLGKLDSQRDEAFVKGDNPFVLHITGTD